ncbi:rhomboid family intramembrane serine protease [Candidatus Woesearchaeota archaeon]|nr:rhomboid family intramembrane serine protease [Candidatus Woesearchaeota archaeon]
MNVKRQQEVIKTRSPTLVLLGINIVFFILQLLIPGFQKLLMLISSKVVAGEVWRIFTSMFLHGSFGHLLFNMYALMIFGPLIEARIGRKRFWFAYFLAGLVAALAYIGYSYVIGTPDAAAVGASGAIMGILGLVILLLPNLRVLFFFVIPMSMRTAGILFATIDFVGLFNPASSVAHVAHLGGLAVGLLFGWWLLKKKKVFIQKFTQQGFGSGRRTVRVNLGRGDTPPRTNSTTNKKSSDYSKTIELTKDELDDYFKYGKI